MLTSLRIRNLAIAEDLRISFGRGLNVITGETGAGKSIITYALALVLGERADKTMIRAGAEECGVEAVFELHEPDEVDALLEELGLPPGENGTIIVRRTISTSGSGRATINDSPATLQALKRLGDLLVDQHGPHEHQSLLKQDEQLDILDSFGHLWKPREEYEEAHARMKALQSEREQLRGLGDADVLLQIENLTGQIAEIEAQHLEPSTEEELKREHATVANAQRIVELATAICAALSDDEASAFNHLVGVRAQLEELESLLPEATEWRQSVESINVQLQEISGSLNARASTIEGDPERLQQIEDRLAAIHRLKRKYGGSVPDILAHLARAREQLATLEARGENLARLEAELAERTKAMETAGRRLREQRQRAATRLAREVTAELQDIGFRNGRFAVALEDTEPRPSGLDQIEFGFEPNPGEPMRPLRLIASSGEISRVMLAIKAVLAAHDRIPVLVFDEIDANVGGETAAAVGQKMARVAASHQVLCITHLPQVAAAGALHLVVAKESRNGRTLTTLAEVRDQARVDEVARMLGGKDLTSVTLRHARELLKPR